MNSKPRFLQGTYSFEGAGLDQPFLLDQELRYVVPADRRAQLVYFRGGNSADELVYLVLMRGGDPMRYFPIGAKEASHVPLRVVEDLLPETEIEVHTAAPDGTSGSIVLDIGIVES